MNIPLSLGGNQRLESQKFISASDFKRQIGGIGSHRLGRSVRYQYQNIHLEASSLAGRAGC